MGKRTKFISTQSFISTIVLCRKHLMTICSAILIDKCTEPKARFFFFIKVQRKTYLFLSHHSFLSTSLEETRQNFFISHHIIREIVSKKVWFFIQRSESMQNHSIAEKEQMKTVSLYLVERNSSLYSLTSFFFPIMKQEVFFPCSFCSIRVEYLWKRTSTLY